MEHGYVCLSHKPQIPVIRLSFCLLTIKITISCEFGGEPEARPLLRIADIWRQDDGGRNKNMLRS